MLPILGEREAEFKSLIELFGREVVAKLLADVWLLIRPTFVHPALCCQAGLVVGDLNP